MMNETTCGFENCGEYEANENHGCLGEFCICDGKRDRFLCHAFAPDYTPSLAGAPLDHPAFEDAPCCPTCSGNGYGTDPGCEDCDGCTHRGDACGTCGGTGSAVTAKVAA